MSLRVCEDGLASLGLGLIDLFLGFLGLSRLGEGLKLILGNFGLGLDLGLIIGFEEMLGRGLDSELRETAGGLGVG